MKDKLEKLFIFAVKTLSEKETTGSKLKSHTLTDLVENFYETREKTGIKLLKISEDEFYDIYEHYADYVESRIKSVKVNITLE